MGRKRKDAVKVNVNLRIEPDLLAELNKLGVNKSDLFDKAARAYIKDNSVKSNGKLTEN